MHRLQHELMAIELFVFQPSGYRHTRLKKKKNNAYVFQRLLFADTKRNVAAAICCKTASHLFPLQCIHFFLLSIVVSVRILLAA